MQRSLLAILALSLLLSFGNACTAAKTEIPTAISPTPTPLAQALTAWTAPVGDPVPGVTLYEGWQDLRFINSPVNVDGGWTDSAHISANGNSLYFAYSRFDFFKFFISNATSRIVTGPQRTGMNGNEFKIFLASLTPSGWSVQFHPVNSSDGNLPESSPTLNQSENLMVFTRWVSQPTFNADLYFSQKGTDGTWSNPVAVGINTSCIEDNGFIVGSLDTSVSLYFESTRLDDAGTSCGTKKRLYYTTYANGAFTPVKLVAGLNANVANNDEDDQPFVTLDQSNLYWTYHRQNTYGIYMADRVAEASYSNIRPVALPSKIPPISGKVVFIGEANVAEVPEGSLLYMMCGLALNENNGNQYLDSDNIRLKICRARKPKSG